MKSMDWADFESYHNQLVAKLFDFAADHGLSITSSDDRIVIQLPTQAEINAWPEVKKRKHFDISKWGNKGIDESTDIQAMPDDFQMPEYGEQLEEGEPPKGDKDEEK